MRNILHDIRQLLGEHAMIEPDPTVRFRQFSPSSLDISVVFFVLTDQMDEFLKVLEEINFKILGIVKNRGAEFAYPTSTVYLKQE
jgi:MscS family membrane protein